MSVPEPSLPFDVVETITRGGTTFEVLEWRRLSGSEPLAVVQQVFDLNRANVRLRQLRVRLKEDSVRTEPGALQFLRGAVQMESSTGGEASIAGFARAALAAARTGESVFKPLYRGTLQHGQTAKALDLDVSQVRILKIRAVRLGLDGIIDLCEARVTK